MEENLEVMGMEVVHLAPLLLDRSPLFQIDGHTDFGKKAVQKTKFKDFTINRCHVYCWGNGVNSFRNFFATIPIVQVACGAQHCLLLTRDQGLYVWGSNEHGQLGLGNQSEGIGVHSDGLGENGWVAKSPVLLPFFNGLDIDCIVCGKSQSSVLVSSSSSFFNSSSSSSSSSSDHLSHDIYVWGWDSMSQTVACSPLLLELNEIGNKKVVQLVHGLRHSLLLVEVEKGVSEVWVWGYSQTGGLGLGEGVEIAKRPTIIESLSDKNVFQIASSPTHNLAISFNGTIYGWGANEKSQLCSEEKAKIDQPTVIQGFPDQLMRHVVCGTNFSLATSREGTLYSWGVGTDGRLGLNSDDDFKTPQQVASLKAEQEEVLVAGGCYDHSYALCYSRAAYVWGNGQSFNINPAQKVNVKAPAKFSANPLSLFCGEGFTVGVFGEIAVEKVSPQITTYATLSHSLSFQLPPPTNTTPRTPKGPPSSSSSSSSQPFVQMKATLPPPIAPPTPKGETEEKIGREEKESESFDGGEKERREEGEEKREKRKEEEKEEEEENFHEKNVRSQSLTREAPLLSARRQRSLSLKNDDMPSDGSKKIKPYSAGVVRMKVFRVNEDDPVGYVRILSTGQFFIDKKDILSPEYYFEHVIHTKYVRKQKKRLSTFRNVAENKYLSRPSSGGTLQGTKKAKVSCFVDTSASIWKIFARDLAEANPPFIGMDPRTHNLICGSADRSTPILFVLEVVSEVNSSEVEDFEDIAELIKQHSGKKKKRDLRAFTPEPEIGAGAPLKREKKEPRQKKKRPVSLMVKGFVFNTEEDEDKRGRRKSKTKKSLEETDFDEIARQIRETKKEEESDFAEIARQIRREKDQSKSDR